MSMLDKWGAETPFALPEEDGVNVLAVSPPTPQAMSFHSAHNLPYMYVYIVFIVVWICGFNGSPWDWS